MKIYIFDLDNTLIFTDDLNNKSYNYSLTINNLNAINTDKRITKETIFKEFPNLNNIQKRKIVKDKQKYFVSNLDETKPNNNLINYLKSLPKNKCILWTRANKKRTESLIDYYGLTNNFNLIINSDKKNIEKDFEELCHLFSCEIKDIILYEDDREIIKEAEKLGVSIITV